ncbi:UBX domain-containing protein 11 [Sphaeramia orbicularis]|uniref:UBX domain-containing protein 11 n=1 Tax=Sphaeramia orbicularis TaxID=375764 RepID=UPI00117C1C8B|nr:UBX domain-containing protein 11 [Sphaeramia orbicularis]
MSSPLSMLKKTRRLPLCDPMNEQWGRQKVPFRRNLLTEFKAEVSSEMHVPLASNAHLSDGLSTSKSKTSQKKGAPPSDFELMSAMMQRISMLEKTVRSQAQEIETKDKKISALEEKLKKKSGHVHDDDLSCRHELERRCEQLQNQVCEMESFLNDYGLIWVGDGETSEHEETHSSEKDLQSGSSVGSFHMNFDLVLQRIKELNVVAGEGECFVQTTATGGHLAQKKPIQLRLYRNGIVMFNGPFRSYQEHSTQQCMQDLMDGYFPSELQERFPDGVPLEVHDKRDEEFVFRLPWDAFPGRGQAVCEEEDKSANTPNTQIPGDKLSLDQFLNQLPKVVVRAGRVIDIRDSLRCTLQGSSDAQSSSSVILIDTPTLQEMKERLLTLNSERPSSSHDVITLKVRSEDGDHTYVLKMSYSETIGHLRQYLDKHRGDDLPAYDIISAYPQCTFVDNCQTLQSCGLTTNTSLLLRKKQ